MMSVADEELSSCHSPPGGSAGRAAPRVPWEGLSKPKAKPKANPDPSPNLTASIRIKPRNHPKLQENEKTETLSQE